MLKYTIALIMVTVLWGSSFPVIKIVVTGIGGFRYTWLRGLVSVLVLAPYVMYRFRSRGLESYRRALYGGLLTGSVYMVGLWLQGWGTSLTTASNSAFITSLNVLFVHLYVALYWRRYDPMLGLELLIALTGVYLLTSPGGGLNIGDLLVLLSAIAWATQVLLVSKYGVYEPLIFTWAEMIPPLLFIFPDIMFSNEIIVDHTSLLGIIYLGVFCSAGAFTLQAYGQREVSPEIAALTYLLEPVFASIFAWLILGEYMVTTQLIGASLILFSIGLANTRIISNKNYST